MFISLCSFTSHSNITLLILRLKSASVWTLQFSPSFQRSALSRPFATGQRGKFCTSSTWSWTAEQKKTNKKTLFTLTSLPGNSLSALHCQLKLKENWFWPAGVTKTWGYRIDVHKYWSFSLKPVQPVAFIRIIRIMCRCCLLTAFFVLTNNQKWILFAAMNFLSGQSPE